MSLGVDDQRARLELRAMAHPLRLRILSLLTGAALTAADVARELSLTHANASYHLRHLEAAGLIVVVAQENIRGGSARRYRYDVDRPVREGGVPVDDPARATLVAAVAGELRRRVTMIRSTPGTAHLTDAELWVDPDLWRQLKNQIDAASDTLHRAARPPRSAGTIRVNATMVLFEMRPGAEGPSA